VFVIFKVDAIVEAKLKMTDVGCALALSSLIHQRYAEFSSLLLEGWHKVLLSKKDDKVSLDRVQETVILQLAAYIQIAALMNHQTSNWGESLELRTRIREQSFFNCGRGIRKDWNHFAGARTVVS
jgi:hypothetical protein